MRLAVLALAAAALLVSAQTASAQVGQSGGQSQRQRQSPGQQQEAQNGGPRTPRIAPLRQRANAGPCPYVKILYDAARYVELTDNRATSGNVGFTGEIEGVTSGCSYRDADPIEVQFDLLFNLGKGPQAAGDQKTYRYWVAVTERNNAVLAKEYFDLPVTFTGNTASVTQERTVVIPRAGVEVSGGNFEVLIGFDVTPEMAEFNRSGSRFRVNAGTNPAPTAAPAPAQ